MAQLAGSLSPTMGLHGPLRNFGEKPWRRWPAACEHERWINRSRVQDRDRAAPASTRGSQTQISEPRRARRGQHGLDRHIPEHVSVPFSL
eukprot:3942702-Amphidinium_carterae.1